jgi:hypothetical protein
VLICGQSIELLLNVFTDNYWFLMWQANQTINNDRFLIQKVLGGGGFGIAFQALDRKHNQPVVIKTLNQHQQLQPGFDELQVKFVKDCIDQKLKPNQSRIMGV